MISIVIPVYNEQANLPHLFERLSKAADSWGEPYEVILVDDGSTDGTPVQLARLHCQDERWKSLTFSRNFGHQTAISAGIHFSRGDAVAVLDADLQDPPEELHRLLAKWREGYQVIYAIRATRRENVFKRTAYAVFYRLLKSVASIDIPLDSGDFCVMDRTVVDVLKSMPERTRFVRGLRVERVSADRHPLRTIGTLRGQPEVHVDQAHSPGARRHFVVQQCAVADGELGWLLALSVIDRADRVVGGVGRVGRASFWRAAARRCRLDERGLARAVSLGHSVADAGNHRRVSGAACSTKCTRGRRGSSRKRKVFRSRSGGTRPAGMHGRMTTRSTC